MRLPIDILSGNYKKPRFFLCNTDKEIICELQTTNTQGSFKFNGLSEISFEVSRFYNDDITGEIKVNPYYSKIEAFRLIYVEGFGYFELQGPELVGDGIQESKSCTAYSLEYILSTKYLEDFYVNTGRSDSIEVIYANGGDITPITLYNPDNKNLSLLHLVLEKIYGWNIAHVDSSLQTLSRQFEVDRESVYDFLINEVCEKFNCYIVFDTISNSIRIYSESLTAKFIGDGVANKFIISPPFKDINTVSVDGYKTTRWMYDSITGTLTLEDTPVSGARVEVVDGALTEWETDVFVSFENLAQEININYDADNIKTVLTVNYGDEGTIREVNLGLPYLTDISYYYTVDWMGQDLYDAYTKYLQKTNSVQSDYTNNSQEILKLNDQIYYEKTRLSLEYSLVQSVNSTTVGTYYIRQTNADGTFYYKEVSLPSEYNANENYYSNLTANVTEDKMSNFYNVLKKYFNNENEDKHDDNSDITSWKTDLNNLSEDFEFIEVYTLNYLIAEMDKVSGNRIGNSIAETAINNFLSKVWSELGKTPLEELYLKPYKTRQETNIEAGWSQNDSKNYPYYYPVVLYINSIEKAISKLDVVIKSYEEQRGVFEKDNLEISDNLLVVNNFTDKQLVRLSSFLREDELNLDDIVETSQDDLSSSFKVKQDAMESGRIELQKICQPQLQFSMSMANIYALTEFKPIVDQFQLGKVIRVALRPDYIKQSRLLQVDINFDDFSDFSCEFGELTNLRTQSDIHADLLSKAITAGKSVATNSSYWTRGADSATSTDLKIQQGLLDATTQIKAIDGSQGVVIDKYGIKLQKKDPNTGELDPRQTWMTNNMILMSDDGFKTSRSALGQITVDGNEYYGIIAEMVLSGYIEGTTIKGGDITGTTITGGTITGTNINAGHFNGGTIKIGEYTDEKGNTCYNFEVDDRGNVTMNSVSANFDGYVKTEDLNSFENTVTDNISNLQDQIDGSITTWFEDGEPTLNNAPAEDWDTTKLKNQHLGDLYYDNNTGYCYRWQVQNDVYSWIKITDTDVTKALADAKTAQDTADGKRRVFVSQPTPPYDVGDLWSGGSDGDLKRCVVAKESGMSFDELDWELAANYTTDAKVNETVQTEISKTVDSISLSVNNGETSSNIKLTVGDIEISSADISMTGVVTFNDLSGSETTTINGDNIKTGKINAIDIIGSTITGSAFETKGNTSSNNNSKIVIKNGIITISNNQADYLKLSEDGLGRSIIEATSGTTLSLRGAAVTCNELPILFGQTGDGLIHYSTATPESRTTIKFQENFSQKPVVIVNQVFNSINMVVEEVTTTGFTVRAYGTFAQEGDNKFTWVAIGYASAYAAAAAAVNIDE